MAQLYKNNYIWFLTLIASAACNLHELYPCAPPQHFTKSLPSDPTRSEPTRSTLAPTLRPNTSQHLCNSHYRTKLNESIRIAVETFMNVSSSITSKRLKRILNTSHYENLPFARHADRSVRNTIRDLFALKQHWDNISNNNYSNESMAVKRLMCSIATATDVPSITVSLPVITDAIFAGNMTRDDIIKSKYIIMKDICSYLENLRNQSCVA